MTDLDAALRAKISDLIIAGENLSLYGRCPCGRIRRARTRQGIFGETITEPYCPACDGSDDA